MLGNNRIDVNEACILGDGLKNNSAITSIDLSGNILKSYGVSELLKALEVNKRINKLDLSIKESINIKIIFNARLE